MARHNCCNDYTRSQLLRSAAAEAGRGLPAIEAGMPEPAGTGLSRRSFLSWSAGLALAVYGASKIPLAAFEEGIAQAAPPTRSSSRSSSTAASTRSACSPRPATRATRSCGPTWRSPPTPAPSSPRTRGCAGTPRPPALATLHEEGKVSAFPAIGYDHPDQSHFTSRHYYEIGELDVGFHTGWLGRYIDQVGDDDNPLQGLSMDGSLSPMIATANRPVAAIDSVDGYDLWSHVSEPISDEMYKSFARFGSLPSDSPGLAQVRRATAQTDKLRTDLGGIGDFTSLVTYPDTELLPQARRPRRLHRRRPADAGGDDPRLGRLRHPRRRGRRPLAGPARDLRGGARLPARPRSARPRRPGPDQALERVRPPPRGERLARHRPRRRRLRLRRRLQSQGRDGRRVPRPGPARPERQRPRDQRLPRRCTARCWSSGWATTRPRSSRAPPPSSGRSW